MYSIRYLIEYSAVKSLTCTALLITVMMVVVMMELFLCCQDEDIQLAVHEFCAEVLNKNCLLNVEYKNAGIDCVSLCHADSKDDIAQLLISEGWLLVESRREKRLAKLVSQYQKAQEKAKEGRVSVKLF